MKTVWKWNLEIDDEQEIEAPDNAQILCVQMQNGAPCLWMLVDPNVSTRKYGVRTKGTGHPIDTDGVYWIYAGSYQMYDGQIVFHVFVA